MEELGHWRYWVWWFGFLCAILYGSFAWFVFNAAGFGGGWGF